jgi:Lrp/AsnC family transcriptional regulator, leucine-responsive regulatory protein
MHLDELDLRILTQLQADASLTNDKLAQAVHASAPTCLRRVRRLRGSGVIQQVVAVLDPRLVGEPLTAIVEITLQTQTADAHARFEMLVAQEVTVQQCYRVSTGPDFVLIITVRDMGAYYALVHRLLTAANHVRNVRTFFSIKRSKFEVALPLPWPD